MKIIKDILVALLTKKNAKITLNNVHTMVPINIESTIENASIHIESMTIEFSGKEQKVEYDQDHLDNLKATWMGKIGEITKEV